MKIKCIYLMLACLAFQLLSPAVSAASGGLPAVDGTFREKTLPTVVGYAFAMLTEAVALARQKSSLPESMTSAPGRETAADAALPAACYRSASSKTADCFIAFASGVCPLFVGDRPPDAGIRAGPARRPVAGMLLPFLFLFYALPRGAIESGNFIFPKDGPVCARLRKSRVFHCHEDQRK